MPGSLPKKLLMSAAVARAVTLTAKSQDVQEYLNSRSDAVNQALDRFLPSASANVVLLNARGWVRTDGRPFADTVASIDALQAGSES